ncbi:alpha/beta hydrolase [Streptomyces sp. NPDC089799]|uniref:alpha/beta fold hydrolase n=1 Tax=Streptomyces sp. NPDC089799 TaxID=3155066 RepID=UPI00341B90AE
MEHAYSSDGTAIAYDRQGAGPVLVLVGGTLMTRARHAALAALLAEEFTVVSYDRRGRGDSGDHAEYLVARELDDLDAVIAQTGGGPVLLYGMSSGGVLALEAVARGSAVSRLAVYEPPLVVDDSRPPLPEDYVERVTELLAGGDPAGALTYFLTAGLAMPAEAVAGMRGMPFWPHWEATARTLPYDGRVMSGLMSGRPLPADRWRSVSVPVLVAHGDAGDPAMSSAAKELASRADHFTLRCLPGQNHNVDPGALAPVLTEFFTATARTRS